MDNQKQQILAHPEVSDAISKLSASGASQDVVDNVVDEAINSIPGSADSKEVAELVSNCILKKLREFEQNRDPRTGAGKFIKKVFD